MTRSTPGAPVDITAEISGIEAYARTTVRLHPRPGTPSAADSHIGGPLLWPAEEPWPFCERPFQVWFNRELPSGSTLRNFEERAPQTPVAMVSVAQFYAR